MEYPDLGNIDLFPLIEQEVYTSKSAYKLINIDMFDIDTLFFFINSYANHPIQIEYATILYRFYMEI